MFSISESEILLTKWASYRRLRYPSPIFEQTDLEDKTQLKVKRTKDEKTILKHEPSMIGGKKVSTKFYFYDFILNLHKP